SSTWASVAGARTSRGVKRLEPLQLRRTAGAGTGVTGTAVPRRGRWGRRPPPRRPRAAGSPGRARRARPPWRGAARRCPPPAAARPPRRSPGSAPHRPPPGARSAGPGDGGWWAAGPPRGPAGDPAAAPPGGGARGRAAGPRPPPPPGGPRAETVVAVEESRPDQSGAGGDLGDRVLGAGGLDRAGTAAVDEGQIGDLAHGGDGRGATLGDLAGRERLHHPHGGSVGRAG